MDTKNERVMGQQVRKSLHQSRSDSLIAESLSIMRAGTMKAMSLDTERE